MEQNGVPYYYDTASGKYISAVNGQEFDSVASLIATDKPTVNLLRQLAGRTPTHRELGLGGTEDEPIEDVKYRNHTITSNTADYKPPSAVESAQVALDHIKQRNAVRNESPGERQQRLAEERLAAAQAEQAATAEREEIANSPETRENIAKARELQRRHQFVKNKKRSTLDQCERAVGLASTGQTVEFEKLYGELNGMLVDHLQSTSKAKMDELADTINEANAAIAQVTE